MGSSSSNNEENQNGENYEYIGNYQKIFSKYYRSMLFS